MSGPVEKLVNETKQTIKKVTKKMLRYVMPYLLLFILILFICVSAYQALSDAYAKLVDSFSEANPVKYSSDPTASSKSIDIDDKTVDELIKYIESTGIKISNLNLSKDDIKKFYIAELVSQEINRGGEEEEGKYYGRVYVKKASSESNSTEDAQPMQFLPYQTFMQKYQAKENNIKDYFTLNGDKLVVAGTKVETNGKGVETTTLTLCEKEYKTAIAKYAMPLEFLLDLAFITQNPNFVSELADKVINNTRIEITVMDNTTTIESDITYKYKVATSTDKEGRVYKLNQDTLRYEIDSGERKPEKGHPEVTIDEDFTIETEKTKTVTNEPNIQITSVDTWITKEIVKYNNNKADPVKGEPNTEKIDDEEQPTHSDENYKLTDAVEEEGEDHEWTEIQYYVSEIKYKVEQEKETTETITTNKYTQGTIEQSEDKINEFVELLKKQYDIPGSNIKEAPIGKLKNGDGLFFEMLKKSSKAQQLEQLMRYILNEYTGTNKYGNITKKDIINGLSIGMITVGSNYTVDTGKLSSDLVITDPKVLKTAVEKLYSGERKDNLSKEASNFIKMQMKYNVNAVFAMAVTIVESGGGTAWAAIAPSTYNWYSIQGSYNGNSYNGKWRAYSNFGEATDDFGDLIANSIYYFKNGKYTVQEIAPTYCNEEWGYAVISHMNEIYEAAGIELPISGFKTGGVTNEEERKELENKIQDELINTKPHYKDSQYQSGPFAKWWQSGYNALEPFQCTWWAYGRALMYLESIGSPKSAADLDKIAGNGGQYYDLNIKEKQFNYGKTPKPNSIISWSGGSEGYGHVAYVEGVDKDGSIYISHAGAGYSWYGITKIPASGDLASSSLGWTGYTLNGYIYLDEPR